MKLVDGRLVAIAADNDTSCVVCGKPAEDDLPYCSLQCECQAKYEEDVQWQQWQQWQQSQAAKKEDDDEDEIQQLMRLRR